MTAKIVLILQTLTEQWIVPVCVTVSVMKMIVVFVMTIRTMMMRTWTVQAFVWVQHI